jgi:hypothetical protein
MSSASDRLQHHFFQLATQYYVAGRFAVLAQFTLPVPANLLHHAIEMYLKAALAAELTLPELKSFGHHLTRAWEKFKLRCNDPGLAVFDSAVADLDKFETIRYPDSIVNEGMDAQLALFRGDLVVPSTPIASTSEKYQFVLEDIDALVKVVFEKANVDPHFYLSAPTLSKDSLRYLSEHNRHVTV